MIGSVCPFLPWRMGKYSNSSARRRWMAVSPEGHIPGSFRGGHVSPLRYIITNTTYFSVAAFWWGDWMDILVSDHNTNYTLSPGRSATVPVTDSSTTGIASLRLHACFTIIALWISKLIIIETWITLSPLLRWRPPGPRFLPRSQILISIHPL